MAHESLQDPYQDPQEAAALTDHAATECLKNLKTKSPPRCFSDFTTEENKFNINP
jgi:hypothetical protein